MEMPPETSYISLHHLPAHHVRIIIAITIKKSLLLLCNRGMIRLVESFFYQVHYLLALIFREKILWRRGIEQTCDCHWMLRILREVSAEIDIVGEVWLILILGVKIAVEELAKIQGGRCTSTQNMD